VEGDAAGAAGEASGAAPFGAGVTLLGGAGAAVSAGVAGAFALGAAWATWGASPLTQKHRTLDASSFGFIDSMNDRLLEAA
jgi:hypothetical protein